MNTVRRNLMRLTAKRTGSAKQELQTQCLGRKAKAALSAAAAIAIVALVPPAPAEASTAAACGTVYTVARGDTLFKIARRTYGDGKLYKKVYAANRSVLRDEGAVEIGDQVFLPCFDGSGPASRAEAVIAGVKTDGADMGSAEHASGNAEADALDRTEPALRVLADGSLGDLAGDTLRNGGFMTDLISRAAAPAVLLPYFGARADDHLDLLASGAFELAYPRLKPSCASATMLSETEARQCAEFVHSAPIAEATLAFYTRLNDESGAIRSHRDLAGKRVCIGSSGLASLTARAAPELAGARLVAARDAETCFLRLVRGEADLAALPRRDAEPALGQRGVGHAISENRSLAITRTLHAVAAKSNPTAVGYLARIDRGMAEMLATGTWFKILLTHRSQQIAAID